jgi:hypothetical protein
MKKVLATVAAALIMSATVALAATPAAPVFSLAAKSTKAADGFFYGENDNKQLVVDGNNVYVAFDGSGSGQAKIVRSTDGGLTWNAPVLMSATGAQIRIAKTKDPLYTGKSIIVAAWSDVDGLRYSYFVDRPTGTGWSVPVVVTDTVPMDTLKIATAPNGAVHIFFNNGSMFHAVASGAEAAFSAPAALPWSADGNNYSIAFDSGNNIYAAEQLWNDTAATAYVTLHKNVAGTATWSNVQVASNVGDNLSIAVYDANNIYIAYKQNSATTLSIWLAATTNGGKTWTKLPVTPNKTVYGTYPTVAVNSSKVVTVVGHYVNWGPDGRITVNKTSDNGATWSANVNVPGNANSGVTLDASGKACVVSSGDSQTFTDAGFYNGTWVDWSNPVPLYFSREK